MTGCGLRRSRDGADAAWFEQDLRAGEWTGYARDSFRIGDSDIAGHVRMKCIELTPDAERFELFCAANLAAGRLYLPERRGMQTSAGARRVPFLAESWVEMRWA